MRVFRGRASTPEADVRVTEALVDYTARRDEPSVRVWTPHPHVAFGRRDAAEPRYEEARRIARREGFPPVERMVGGRAVAYTGTTIAFARCVPVEDHRRGLDERYDAMTADALTALSELGVEARRGEPEDSFCPGTHSLRTTGKLVGIAQRVRSDAALVSGIAIVDDRDTVARILERIYDPLGLAFDPESVGSIAQSGGPADPVVVAAAFEDALVGDDASSSVSVASVSALQD